LSDDRVAIDVPGAARRFDGAADRVADEAGRAAEDERRGKLARRTPGESIRS